VADSTSAVVSALPADVSENEPEDRVRSAVSVPTTAASVLRFSAKSRRVGSAVNLLELVIH
jgi:hypothetical protein